MSSPVRAAARPLCANALRRSSLQHCHIVKYRAKYFLLTHRKIDGINSCYCGLTIIKNRNFLDSFKECVNRLGKKHHRLLQEQFSNINSFAYLSYSSTRIRSFPSTCSTCLANVFSPNDSSKFSGTGNLYFAANCLKHENIFSQTLAYFSLRWRHVDFHSLRWRHVDFHIQSQGQTQYMIQTLQRRWIHFNIESGKKTFEIISLRYVIVIQ